MGASGGDGWRGGFGWLLSVVFGLFLSRLPHTNVIQLTLFESVQKRGGEGSFDLLLFLGKTGYFILFPRLNDEWLCLWNWGIAVCALIRGTSLDQLKHAQLPVCSHLLSRGEQMIITMPKFKFLPCTERSFAETFALLNSLGAEVSIVQHILYFQFS